MDIYSGAITNWQEVGGSDAAIRVVSHEEGDSSRGVLSKTFPGFQELILTSKAKITFSDPETEELIQSKSGVIAYGLYSNAKVIDVNVLTIGGQSPVEKEYPYIGVLGSIYKEQNYTGIVVKAYVEFATSDAGHEAIRTAGGIPIQ